MIGTAFSTYLYLFSFHQKWQLYNMSMFFPELVIHCVKSTRIQTKMHARRYHSVPPTSLSPPAGTGSRPPLKCADTSSEPVPAYTRAPPDQCRGKQCVVILLRWLIVNRLDNRGYYSRTTFWRGESRCTEGPKWRKYRKLQTDAIFL